MINVAEAARLANEIALRINDLSHPFSDEDYVIAYGAWQKLVNAIEHVRSKDWINDNLICPV